MKFQNMLKIYHAFIFLAVLGSCVGTNLNQQKSKQDTMRKYKDDDLILAMSVTKHNIANPQYNYELVVYGNGKIVRKGGVYKSDYPDKVSKEVLDSIVEKGEQIKNHSLFPKAFVHDGPTCNLKVYGHPTSLDFCGIENEAVSDLINYVDSVIVIPVN